MIRKKQLKAPRFNATGFTLVEMLITVSIFALAFALIGGIFVAITVAQSRARGTTEYLNEGQLVFEQMIREIRSQRVEVCSASCTGSNYICLSDLANGKTYFRRMGSAGSGSVEINRNTTCSSASTAWVRLSDPNVDVSSLQFYSTPETPGQQPFTTVTMSVRRKGAQGQSDTTVYFQTSVSGRVFLATKPDTGAGGGL